MVGRNELCPCGSGRKYKKCCLEKDKAKDIARKENKQIFYSLIDEEILNILEEGEEYANQS